MNSSDMYQPPKNTVPELSLRARRLVPSWWLVIPLTLIFGCALIARLGHLTGDNGMGNIFVVLATIIVFIVIGAWFLFRSGYSILFRLAALALFMITLATIRSTVRIEGTNGELIPRLVWKWSPPRDATLPEIVVTSGEQKADLSKTGPNDFPQFLGPSRTNRYDVVKLSTDWSSKPPKELWRRNIGAGWSGFAIVNGCAVTMEQRGDLELVSCYSVETGEPIWIHSVKARHETVLGGIGPRGTPTIHNGRVYAQGATGEFVCLNGTDGSVVWKTNLVTKYGSTVETDVQGVAWGRSGSPLIVDDLVVIPAGGKAGGPYVSLVAFNQETGDVVWESGDRQVSYASPVLLTVAGVRQIVSINENLITGHDPKSGKILWRFDWEGSSTGGASVSNPMPIDSDKLFLSKGYGKGAELIQLTSSTDPQSLTVTSLWSDSRILKTKFTNAVIYDGHAYGLSDGVMECVHVASGKRTWRASSAGRFGHGQVLGVSDLLLVQGESGEVVLLKPDATRLVEVARLDALHHQTWNNPSLYGNRLLVRNANEAACYELPLIDSHATIAE